MGDGYTFTDGGEAFTVAPRGTGPYFLTDLAAVCRAAGATVVELDGWQTRARSSGGYGAGLPGVVMFHHTASAGDGASDANYCTYVDPDRPVTNLVIGRDGTVYVCAAGATNTNGKGGPYTLPNGRTVPADSMNLWAIAIELSNNGVGQSYPAVQLRALFSVHLALAAAYLDGDVTLVAGHVDWTTRKIDPATAAAVDPAYGWRPRSINSSGSWSIDDVRAHALALAAAGPAPAPDPPEVDDMHIALIAACDGTDEQRSAVFWWDGKALGWVRTGDQISIGQAVGFYTGWVNADTFTASAMQQLIEASWAGGPTPPGYTDPEYADSSVT